MAKIKTRVIREVFGKISSRHDTRHSHLLNIRAATAEKLIERMVVAPTQSDGEDSQGRQKFRLLTPEEIVARAMEIADCFITTVEEKNWLIEVEEINNRADD